MIVCRTVRGAGEGRFRCTICGAEAPPILDPAVISYSFGDPDATPAGSDRTVLVDAHSGTTLHDCLDASISGGG